MFCHAVPRNANNYPCDVMPCQPQSRDAMPCRDQSIPRRAVSFDADNVHASSAMQCFVYHCTPTSSALRVRCAR
eukprot:4441949-Lingulodinium_polyedra.AAC.1